MTRSAFYRFLRPVRPSAAAAFAFALLSSLAFGFLAGQASAATQSVAPAAVPPALRPALYQALAKDAGSAYALDKNGCATLAKSTLKACFDGHGAHFDGTRQLSLHLAAFGRGPKLAPVVAVRPVIEANRVSYKHGNLTEWWRVLPMGFEQGFTINKRPAGHGDLTLILDASRQDSGAPTTRRPGESQNPVKTSPLIPLRSEGGKEIAWGKLRYGKLVVTDTKGKVVPATMTTNGDRILIAVNDADATYPLTVDPLVWLEQKVTAGDGAEVNYFGAAVAIDGTTAVVGAPGMNQGAGAAYVFAYADTGAWYETQELAASDGHPRGKGFGGDRFGSSVALSGTTAVIGADNYCGDPNAFTPAITGAAYVFTASSGTWTQTTELFSGSFGGQYIYTRDFGHAVAIDGDNVLIGAPVAGDKGEGGPGLTLGRVFVFKRNGNTWAQAEPLHGAGSPEFGESVAIDGDTALIGGHDFVWVFNQSADVWTFTANLSPIGYEPGSGLGLSAALDGNTALVGAPATKIGDIFQGAAYVFTNSGDAWNQTKELTATDGTNNADFGISVALDGTTAIVTAPDTGPGTVYVYTGSGGNWTQTREFTATGAENSDEFGLSAALSGSAALIGAQNATVSGNLGQGAAYFYNPANLDLTLSAPASVAPDANYVSQTIVTNAASTVSPTVAITVPIPAAASFVSATATEGSCYNNPTSVYCYFGQIEGNAGTASASVTFKAKGEAGTTIENQGAVLGATPALSASAPTTISSNSPPVAEDGTLTAQENKLTIGGFEASDPDGDPLTYSIVTQPTHGSVSLENSNGSTSLYIYKSAADYTGPDSFTFKVNDGTADSNVATISITVIATSTNHPPVASNGTLSVNENAPADGTLVATDADGDPLTFSTVTPASHGSVAVQYKTGAYIYTPTAGYTGPDSFTFHVNDGQADSNVATISITVASSNNHAPVASDATLTTGENASASGTLVATDADGDPLTFSIVTPASHGSVNLQYKTGAYTYTPTAGYSGPDSFTFHANDGQADSNVATVSLTVIASGSGSSTTVTTDAGPVTFTTSSGQITVLTALQPPQAPSDLAYPVGWFSYAISGLTPGATVTVKVEVPEALVIIAYLECYNAGCAEALDAIFDGNTITLTLTDGGAGDTDGTVNGVITDPGAPAAAKASNQPPVAGDGTLTTDENKAASGTLQASDADGDPLTFAIVASPGHGAVKINDVASGTYTYTPNQGYSGKDSFTFRANDGKADSNAAKIRITVKKNSGGSDGGGSGSLGGLGLGLLALFGLAGFIRRRR